MAAIASQVVDKYFEFMETKSDPRTSEWFLMSGPGPLVFILVTYLYFCNKVGPQWMEKRKPYDLKPLLIAYNLIQVLFSVWLVWEGLQGGWLHHYNLKCQPVDYSNDPVAIRMANACWWYFFCKLIELLDTVFFVLRKKNNQISFLHLYHHTLMPVCAWIGTKFLPGGHGTFLGVINSFVHIIMYFYYMMSAMGPQYQKYLWWKKYLTTLQMVQFCMIFIHSSQLLIYECNYPKTIIVLLGINALFFLGLFGNFYRKSYKARNMKVE
uniref:Elongation of very long chain fatty acids protein n=1 Tax=Orthetrum albistylum TaxID=254766 RepID=A0A499UNA9_9ODON|nr:elongation of very long chain fatty acids protein 9 [Orthetrum albistylum]